MSSLCFPVHQVHGGYRPNGSVCKRVEDVVENVGGLSSFGQSMFHCNVHCCSSRFPSQHRNFLFVEGRRDTYRCRTTRNFKNSSIDSSFADQIRSPKKVEYAPG